MEDLMPEGETFEIDEPCFQCLVCEEDVEFEFQPGGPVIPETDEELPEELEEDIVTPENFAEEVTPEMEGNDEETMRIDCSCGAEYLVKKVPGVPGFEVVHIIEEEPELVEKEFEEEFEV